MGNEMQEIRRLGEKELNKILQEKQMELRKLRFQKTEGKLRQNHLVKKNKLTISRIKTVLKLKNEG